MTNQSVAEVDLPKDIDLVTGHPDVGYLNQVRAYPFLKWVRRKRAVILDIFAVF